MPHSSFFGRHLRLIVAATSCLAIGIAGLGAALPSSAAAPDADPSAVALAAPVSTDVTLITGDRVTVTEVAGGQRAVSVDTVDPGAGFRTFEAESELHVVPDEALPYLAAGLLDDDLFNVSKLIEFGYDDASVDATPIIVERTAASARTALTLPGVDVTTPLPSVSASAATASHDDSDTLWDALTSTRSRGPSDGRKFPEGIVEIHLDGKVAATLDSSVPYIDAPEAWALGYDGEGVTVAVLDSGYDDTHPDLAGRVSGDSASFVPGEEVGNDPNGHGTHVASTIAGTGAASAGKQRGVADGADLLVGKVLGADGFGQESWIIAGMEWAAKNAPIVSMSLGSREPSDGTDLMATALDRIAKDTGALFVVAAGNNGTPGSIGSPGAAPSALTIGSVVDPSGLRSSFSSQGPVFLSGALKPDLTGPGTNVTAARSSDGAGQGPYITMSGTSMATPHVAGAAAILKQKHPEYTGTQLKAALTSSAADLALTPYEAGTGVVDVDAAVEAAVVAAGSGDFGMLKWGQTPTKVTRSIAYTNRTDAEVTVALAVAPAFVGLTMDAESLTIPAGETREVAVTVDQSKLPAATQVSGMLVASIGGQPVARTALGAIVEAERYDLTMTATDFAGNPTQTTAWLWNAETRATGQIPVDGETTLRLPPGKYMVMSFMQLQRTPDTLATALVGDPDVVLDHDQTVKLDARATEKVTVDVNAGVVEPSFRRMNFTADGFTGTFVMPVLVDEMWAQPLTGNEADFDFTTRWRLQRPALALKAGGEPLDVTTAPGSTMLDGKLNAKAVNAGTGTTAEFANAAARDKVAVVTRSAAVSATARAANAAAAGAKLLIVVNDSDTEFSEWVGASDFATPVAIPVVSVSGVEGRALLAAIAAEDVVVSSVGIPYTPDVWDIARYTDGEIPQNLAYEPRKLARIDASYHGSGDDVGEARYDLAPGTTTSVGLAQRTTTDFDRTEWVNTERITWYQEAGMLTAKWQIRDAKRIYQPGERTEADFFGSIIRPNVGPGYFAPFRQGNVAQINLPGWADGGDPLHTGSVDLTVPVPGSSQLTQVWVDGTLRGSTQSQRVNVYNLPAAAAQFRVVKTATHNGSQLPSSTETTTEWNFRSTGLDDTTRRLLPMIQAYYDVELGEGDRAGDGRRKGSGVPLRLELGHVGGAFGADKITGATIEVRGADGTWKPLTMKPATTDAPAGATEPTGSTFTDGRSFVKAFTVDVPVADKGGWVDLRVTAKDAAGNTFSQEIARAFEAAPASGAK